MKPPPELRRGFKDPKRLDKIRQLPCLICKGDQKSPTEVHHYWGTGAGKKESDRKTMPLCNFHHTGSFGGHVVGETIHAGLREFEAKHGTQEELIERTNELLNKIN